MSSKNLPISNLFHFLQPTDLECIFACGKQGFIQGVPLSQLLFIVIHRFTCVNHTQLADLTKVKGMTLFAFEAKLLSQVRFDNPDDFKKNVLKYVKTNKDCFAKSLNDYSGCFYQSCEQQIEWKPTEEDKLFRFANLPDNVRIELNLPHPFTPENIDCFHLKDGTVFFKDTSMIYNFAKVENNKIVVRHYQAVDKEKKLNILFYCELDFNGKYICRHFFDENEFFKFGRNTVFGPYQLDQLLETVYKYDADSKVEFLISQKIAYDNTSYQSRVKQDIKLCGMDNFSDEDDDFLSIVTQGMDLDKMKDFYGGYEAF